MARKISTAVLALLLGLAVHQARAESIVQQVASFGLLGEWAGQGNCRVPATPIYLHLVFAPNADGVTITYLSGAAPTSVSIAKIEDLTQDTISFVFSDPQQPDLLDYRTYKKSGNQLRLMESGGSNGKVFVHSGMLIATGLPTPLQDHCSETAETAARANSNGTANKTTAPSGTGDALPRISVPQCRSAQHLKDADASCLAEFYLDQFSFKFPLGSFSLVSDLAAQTVQQNQPGTMTNAGLQDYQALASIGLVRLSNQQTAPQGNNGFNWNNFLAQTQGVQGRVQVAATPTGQALLQAGTIVLPAGAAQVNRIVRNEELKKGVERYAIILGTLTRNFLPQFRQYLNARHIALASNQRFQMLLKYDAFAADTAAANDQWKLVTYDTANEGTDFGPSSSVNRTVAGLQ